MPFQEVEFTRPVLVLQVFRNVYYYSKAEKSFSVRKEKAAWQDISSKSGYVEEGELFLPSTFTGCKNSDLVTIEDDRQEEAIYPSKGWFTGERVTNQCFNLHHPVKFDVFEIRMTGKLELHLKPGYFETGIPERKEFKVCEIRQGKPVEVKINGKTDFSLTSRRERMYKEQHYIFELLGEFSRARILKEPFEGKIKHVPEKRKIIDLLKPLW